MSERRSEFAALSWAVVTAAWMAFVPGSKASAGTSAADPDGSWLEFSPPLRQGHSAVYDAPRNRMIVIGGASTTPAMSSVWGYSLSSGSWSRLIDSGGPGPRVYASAVLDSAQNRIILFGGEGNSSSGSTSGSVWQLTLSVTPSWTQLTPSGPTPPARAWAAAVFDPVNDRMIVIGGYDRLSDVWQLSLIGNPTWTEITPPGGPGPRMAASAIYDPVRHRVVLFGGRNTSGTGYQNDVWSLSLSGPPVWTRNFALGTPPPPRAGQSAIYDPDTDSMIIFGGSSSYTYYNDVWQFPLSGTPVWSLVSTSGTPPTGRTFHSAIRDDQRDRMVIFGGGNQGQGDQGVFALSLDTNHTWSSLPPVETTPPAQTGHTTIYDPIQDRLILFGGTAFSNLVWQCSLSGDPLWSQLVAQGAPPQIRQNHAAVWDPVRNRMLVFGGAAPQFSGVGPYNDLWALRLDGVPAWQSIGAATPPAARQGHTMIYDPVSDRLIMFGGASNTSNTNVQNDVWQLALGTGVYHWGQITPTGIPPLPRTDAAGVYDAARNRFVIYGGTDGTTVFDDAWALSLTGEPSWELLMPSGSPAQQSDQPAVYDPVRDRLVSLGPGPSSSWDVRAMTFAGGGSWDILSPSGDPGWTGAGGAGIYDPLRDRVVIFGASGPDNRSTWALTWGEGALAWVRGPGERPWTAGSVNTIQYLAYNPFDFPMRLDCQLTCDRNWPGLPVSSVVSVPANDSLPFVLGVPVPDTAMGGAATFHLRAVFRNLPYASSLESRLIDPSRVLAVDLSSNPSLRIRLAQRNPSEGHLRVAFGLAPGAPAQLEVLDAQGRRWRSLVLDARRSSGTVDLMPGESAPAGVYFVRLSQGAHSAFTRAVILR